MGMANCNLILVLTFADEVGGGVVSGVAIPLTVGLLRSTFVVRKIYVAENRFCSGALCHFL